jgi:hypothetical protein
MNGASLSRVVGLITAAALMVAFLTGAILPRRAAVEGEFLCEFQDQLTWCVGFEKDSSTNHCDAETGYQAENHTPDNINGSVNCDNPTDGNTSDVGQIEGDEDLFFHGSGGLTWNEQFTGNDVYYTRFCFYGESDAGWANNPIFNPRSSADPSGKWRGSGLTPLVRWNPYNEDMVVSCPTDGDVVPTSAVEVTDDTWHQITVLWDGTVSAAPVCSLWVDIDSSETPSATIAGSGMDPGPPDIDGVTFEWGGVDSGMHFDFLQVTDTETNLVDVWDNNCQGPVVVCQMDFEGTSDCQHTGDAYDCALSGSGYDAKCDSGTSNCDIGAAGTYSYWTGGCVDLYDTGGPPQTSGDPDTFCDYDGSTTSSGTDDNFLDFYDDAECADAAEVAFTFKFNWADDKDYGGASGNEIIIIRDSTDAEHSRFWLDGSNDPARFHFGCGDAAPSYYEITEDVTYNITVLMDTSGATDDCTVYLNTAASDRWDGSDTEKTWGPTSATSTGNTIGGMSFYNETGDQSFIIDDYGMCDVSGGALGNWPCR